VNRTDLIRLLGDILLFPRSSKLRTLLLHRLREKVLASLAWGANEARFIFLKRSRGEPHPCYLLAEEIDLSVRSIRPICARWHDWLGEFDCLMHFQSQESSLNLQSRPRADIDDRTRSLPKVRIYSDLQRCKFARLP
jgi:hypothetical protein